MWASCRVSPGQKRQRQRLAAEQHHGGPAGGTVPRHPVALESGSHSGGLGQVLAPAGIGLGPSYASQENMSLGGLVDSVVAELVAIPDGIARSNQGVQGHHWRGQTPLLS
jgi:DNA-binding transcriptional LysR family regulator